MVKIYQLFGLSHPFVNNFLVSNFFNLKSLLGFKLLEGDKIQKDQSKTENVTFERVWWHNLFALDLNQLRCQKRYSSENGRFFHIFARYDFATADIAKFYLKSGCVHDQNVFWLDITMSDVLVFQLTKRIQNCFDKVLEIFYCKPFVILLVLCD